MLYNLFPRLTAACTSHLHSLTVVTVLPVLPYPAVIDVSRFCKEKTPPLSSSSPKTVTTQKQAVNKIVVKRGVRSKKYGRYGNMELYNCIPFR